MRLPRYITGFLDEKSAPALMEGVAFKKVGYEIARKLQCEVTHFSSPSYPVTYFRLDIQKDGKGRSILLHKYFPYAALAAFDTDRRIHFVECDDVAAELRPFYEVLDTEFLNEAFHPTAHDLAEVERKQVRYWNPATNGEVIFNCWD